MLSKELDKTLAFTRYLQERICGVCRQTRGYRHSHDNENPLSAEVRSHLDTENLLACPYESAMYDCPDIQDYLAKRPV